MKTPIYDFIKKYSDSDTSRFHMPGHKGVGFLGCEKFDITEIFGADSLYEADGIIKKSEENASEIFQTGTTFYSTEGSSLCIRAMLFAAMQKTDKKLTIAAVRNVHKSFIYACAALGIDIEWIYPKNADSLCSGSADCEETEAAIKKSDPFALYVTSPNYLGEMTDIASLSKICDKYDIPLLVDNAHGAYLKFLSLHPTELGAAMCCDSAHKTLPVLTGGAYLHISKKYKDKYCPVIKDAMAFFASTSPSYLTLASLDLCNKYLSDGYLQKLSDCIKKVDELKEDLKKKGFPVIDGEPLKITVKTNGVKTAEEFRRLGGECEYSDGQAIVFMLTPENSERDFCLIKEVFDNTRPYTVKNPPPPSKGQKILSVRDACLAPWEIVPTEKAVGRICASPTVSCPPAVPIAVSGEIITEETVKIFKFYNIKTVMCVK